jgi:hypothetical protein
VVHGSPSAAAGARTQYVVGFRATGELSAPNGRISVTFPTDTTFAGDTSGTVFDVTTGQSVGSCGVPSGLTIRCSLLSNGVINAGDDVRVTFNGITNPSTAGDYTIDVSTTSDTTPVTSPEYSVAPANELTGVTLTLDSLVAGATTRWWSTSTRRRRAGCRGRPTAASR